jgi:hypothetical protein
MKSLQITNNSALIFTGTESFEFHQCAWRTPESSKKTTDFG